MFGEFIDLFLLIKDDVGSLVFGVNSVCKASGVFIFIWISTVKSHVKNELQRCV